MDQTRGEPPSIPFIVRVSSNGQSCMPKWNARMCSHFFLITGSAGVCFGLTEVGLHGCAPA